MSELQNKLNLILAEKTNKIVATNIKSGVTIFNITGSLIESNEEQNVTVDPLTTAQVVEPNTGYTGLANITINAVTSNIDLNITPTNIRAGVNILGVAGNLEPDKPDQTKSVDPTTSVQNIVADTGYELAKVTVNAVTSNIDSNIVAGNILNGVNILGVTGTVIEVNNEPVVNIVPSIINQIITPNTGYTGLSQVNIAAVDNTIDSNIVAGNILNGVNILGVTGNVTFESFSEYSNCMNIANDILGV